jgi:heme-degrading monooxygenase HmoA
MVVDMPYLLIRHKVRDYATWRAVFDEHGSARKENGSEGGFLFRNADDPDEVIVILEWDSLGKAREFVRSDDLRQTMRRAGVVGEPDICFLDDVARPPG